MSLLKFVLTLFIAVTELSTVHSIRKVTSWLNPNCRRFSIFPDCSACLPNCGFNNLIYYRAVGESDILHYFVSTIGLPSVLVVRADLNSTAEFSWPLTTNVPTIGVTNVLTISAVSIVRLFRFNDRADTGDISKVDNNTKVEPILLDQIRWEQASTNGTLEINSWPGQFGPNGTLTLRVNVFHDEGRHDVVPRLMHSDSMGLLELVLDNFGHPNESYARFAAELAVVQYTPGGNVTTNKTVNVVELSSINDEFSPGSFRTYEIAIDSAFVTWKPSVYRTASRGFESATLMSHTNLIRVDGILNRPGIISHFDNVNLANDPRVTIRSFNVTLGRPKDKFYNAFNYYSWSIAFGMGKMPTDGFSPLIISLIFACFGLPALAIIVGTGFFLFRRFRPVPDELNEPLVT